MGRIKTTIAASAAGTLMAFAIAATAGAQQREIFTWNGRVDQEVQITMSGRNLSTSNIGPSEPGVRRSSVVAMMPRMDGLVTVQMANGRGSADVISQPSAANGYTTVVRVRDPQGGAANYRLNVYWQPVANGEVGPPYGRANGRRNRDVYGNRNNDRGIYNNGNRTALTWSGDVDDATLIRISPSGVRSSTWSGKDARNVQQSVGNLPSGVTNVYVNNASGRGSVEVVQQPSAANGYTATVRVRDPQPGYGHYSFQLLWQ